MRRTYSSIHNASSASLSLGRYVKAHLPTAINVRHLERQSIIIKPAYVLAYSFHTRVLLRKLIVVQLDKKSPLPLRKPDIYYFRVHKSPLPVPVLHEEIPVHRLFPCDIGFCVCQGLPKCSFFKRFATKLQFAFISPMTALRSTHIIFLELIIIIIFDEQ